MPVPFADAAVLGPLETAEISALRKIYEIPDNDGSKTIIDAILEIGTVSIAAKTAISTLKAIPGINLAANIINAIVAGLIVAAIGEGSACLFEKMYRGELKLKDSDEIRRYMEDMLDNEFIGKVTEIINQASDDGADKDAIKKNAKEMVRMLNPGTDRDVQ